MKMVTLMSMEIILILLPHLKARPWNLHSSPSRMNLHPEASQHLQSAFTGPSCNMLLFPPIPINLAFTAAACMNSDLFLSFPHEAAPMGIYTGPRIATGEITVDISARSYAPSCSSNATEKRPKATDKIELTRLITFADAEGDHCRILSENSEIFGPH
ncbi:hypothetical protein J3F83DRAFT_483185 [Trichoderma novae-zelandiae]